MESQKTSPQEIQHLPTKTGVYVFRGRRIAGAPVSVLYVGKAKNLRARVKQYFIEGADPRPFVKFIRERVENIETFVVESEQDALILENEFIKKYRPAYNIHLKDDKRYLSLRIDTSHSWPKIDLVRKIKKDGAFYLGPFSSGGRLKTTLEFMQKVFPLRTCSDHKFKNRSRPCLEFDLKRCVAPCVDYISREDYKKIVDDAILFLNGGQDEILGKLKSQMAEAADNDEFELAAEMRDRIVAIESTTIHQGIIGLKGYQRGQDQDVIGIARSNERLVVVILFVRSGIPLDKRTFEFKSLELDEESFLVEFLNRYYASEVYVPHEVLVPRAISEDLLEFKAQVLVPRSEEKKNFLLIAQENAESYLTSVSQKTQKMQKTLSSLQKLLGLQRTPERMDCFDISHHQGLETVASVVRFQDGLPAKDFYRRLKLSTDQVDDFESMREAVSRRYKTEEDLPDLIVIDGGRGQLSAAQEVLKTLGYIEKLDVVSLAKARDADEVDPLNPMNRERVFKLGQKNPVLLKPDSAEELLLRFLCDEAHRFAIKFHRERKTKNLSFSILDEISGMTEKIKLKLLRRFGDIEGIKAASDLDLLAEIPGRILTDLRAKLGNESKSEE